MTSSIDLERSFHRLERPLLRVVALVGFVAAIAGCGKEDSTPSGSSASAASTPPPTPVTVLQVKAQRVPIVFAAVGQTEGSKQVEVRARVSGILQKRLYTEGQWVNAGTPLFQIDRVPFEIAVSQAKGQLAQDRARTEQTKREEGRLKPLASDRAISRKEYDDALSAMELAQAAEQQSAAKLREAELNLSYTLQAAPLSGMTGRAEHSEGSLITTDAAGSLLTTINQINPMWVRFSLSESDLAKLPQGRLDSGRPIEVGLVLPDGSRYPAKGRLNFTATAIDPKLGTQQLRAEFDNPKGQLLPGQFVRAEIAAGARDNVFLVPQSAVMQTEKSHMVFVVDAADKADLRAVQMGDWVGTNWTVLSGLRDGDRVAVDNLLKIRPGATVSPKAPQSAAGAETAAPAASDPSAKPPSGPAK